MFNLKLQIFNLADMVPLPGGKSLGSLIRQGGFGRYFFNTGWMFVGQAVNMVLSFFVGAWVARYLGPKNYGLMNYAISFGGLFSFLAGFGIDSILTRELVRQPENKEDLLGNAFWIKFFGAILTISAINIVSFVINKDGFSRSLILLFSWTYLFSAFGVIANYFQSQVLSKKNFLAQLSGVSISTVLKLLCIFLHLGIIWFTAILVLESINVAIFLLILYFKQKHKINWNFKWFIIKSLLKDSWPLMFSIAASSIYYKIDQTLLKIMLSDVSVGLYAVAVKLSELWYFIPNIICASLFPAIVNSRKTDFQIYIRRLGNLYLFMFILSLVVVLPVFVMAGPIVKFLFGHAYLASIGVLRIYIWSGIPVFVMAAVTQYLVAENSSKIFFLSTVAGAICNLALNLFLIPRYGIIGSAVATLISYFVPILTLLCFKKSRQHFVLLFKLRTGLKFPSSYEKI